MKKERGQPAGEMCDVSNVYAVVCYISGMNAGRCIITANVWPEAESGGIKERELYRLMHPWPLHAHRGISVWEGL